MGLGTSDLSQSEKRNNLRITDQATTRSSVCRSGSVGGNSNEQSRWACGNLEELEVASVGIDT
jgi:hypothetical protein